jgi:hypothetical protein
LVAVYLFEAALLTIVLDDWSGLGLEGLHALDEDCFGVVGALGELRAVYITDVRNSRWIRIDVEDMTCGADAAAGDAMEELLVVDYDADRDDWQGVRIGGKLGVEPGGLVEGSGKAVEDVAAARIGLTETVSDHLVDEIVGDECALINEGFGLHAERGAL